MSTEGTEKQKIVRMYIRKTSATSVLSVDYSTHNTNTTTYMSKRGGGYRNKIPPFTPDPEHYTRKQHSWKAKEAYETEDDAWEFLNQNPKLRAEGMTAYKCRTCQKWHVGHKG